MQKVRITILAIFTIGLGVSASAQKKEMPKGVVIDKAESGSVVHLNPLSLTQVYLEDQTRASIPLHQMTLELMYPSRGDSPTGQPGNVQLLFRVTSSKYVFVHGQKVLLALDNDGGNGRAIIVGDTNYHSKLPEFNTVYEETLEVSAPVEILSRIAKANSVEIYVGPVAYRLTKDQQQKLANYYAYITS